MDLKHRECQRGSKILFKRSFQRSSRKRVFGAVSFFAVFGLVFFTGAAPRGCGQSVPVDPGEPPVFTQPSFKRVFMVILENEDSESAESQPFMARLAREGAFIKNYNHVARPSQPNYIALVSGETHGVTSNDNYDLPVRHIGDLLEAKGMTWKSYAEGFPGNCSLVKQAGAYVRKHEPFISFKNIQNNSARCANIVEAGELDRDIQNGKLADYSLYIPDLNNDGHDTGIEFADRWLSNRFAPLLADPKFMKDTLFVVTFDESETGPFNSSTRIYNAFYGDSVIAGSSVNYPYDHYSMLRTIEEAFHLGTLGLKDELAHPIGGIWK